MSTRHGLKPAVFWAIVLMAALCVILELVVNHMQPRLGVARDASFFSLSILLAGVIWRFRAPWIRRLVASDSNGATISEPNAFVRYGSLAMVVGFTITVGRHVF